MTGTSVDGIDVALVSIEGRGLAMMATLVRYHTADLGEIGPRLRAVAAQAAVTAGELAALARALGERHADVIGGLLSDRGGAADSPDAIAVHGQTIVHDPPVSWQLIDSAPIARRFACPVVSDLRAADLAAGGQGAPITPIADWILLRHATRRRAIVNLGGFCNVTVLPAGDDPAALGAVAGFDVCACNHVLDAVARSGLDAPFDDGGRAAMAGTADPGAAHALRALLAAQAGAGRSLGTGDEAGAWVDARSAMRPNDRAATAVTAIAGCIAARLPADVDEVVLAGGGTRNAALVHGLRGACAATVTVSDGLGLPACAREAAAMAVLGALSADGVPITLPQVTGCSRPAPVAGRWCGGIPTTATFA